jgi:hypothetical protein
MRLTLAGKIVVFLIFASILYYGWTNLVPAETRASIKLPNLGGIRNTGSAPEKPAGPQGAQAPQLAENEILFVTTAAKKGWVKEQVERFNAQHQGKWRIVQQDIPSREAMHGILEGKVQPVLWSPGGAIWPARLAEAWRERHSTVILERSDPNAYSVFLRSPLVFMTTRRKAEHLRPILGGGKPWAALRELSMGRRKVPWGRFKFSHADPLTSSSGMLTFGLVLNEYTEETGQSPVAATGSPGFVKYLRELETALVYDEAAKKGTTALVNAYLENPDRYDFITAYESHALEAAASHPDLAVIYPNPTAFSEHAVTLLNGEFVTRERREGAQAFMEFLASEEAQRSGIANHFRPTRTSSFSLNDRLQALRDRGFKAGVTSIDLPPYQALNDAAYKFRERIAKDRA